MQMMLLLVTLDNLTILDMRYGCCASEDDDCRRERDETSIQS
jgi:hypothetical protein